MGRIYAGILGPAAFLLVVFRGLLGGNDPQATMLAASLSLFAFAALGYVVGWTAGFIVEDCVHAQIAQEVAEQEAAAERAKASRSTQK